MTRRGGDKGYKMTLADVYLKLRAMVSRRGFQQGLTLGPLCCMFMGGSKMVMAACSKRLSWDRWAQAVTIEVPFQSMLWPWSWACLAGALLMLPVAESV